MAYFSTVVELPMGSATAQVVSHPASHCCDLGSIAVQVMRLWWTRRHWVWFLLSTHIPLSNSYSNCSIVIKHPTVSILIEVFRHWQTNFYLAGLKKNWIPCITENRQAQTFFSWNKNLSAIVIRFTKCSSVLIIWHNQDQ
jgi:hypothetical protein